MLLRMDAEGSSTKLDGRSTVAENSAQSRSAQGGTSAASPAVYPTPDHPTLRRNPNSRQSVELDPRKDGWSSEAFSELASQQLSVLAGLLSSSKPPTANLWQSLLAEDFSCGLLLPETRRRIFDKRTTVVERFEADHLDPTDASLRRYQGVPGFITATRPLLEPFANGQHIAVKFKVVDVQLSTNVVTTRQLLSISGATPAGMVEQNATWMAIWTNSLDDKVPKLKWIGVEQYEQVTAISGGGPWFSDCTAAVLGEVPAYREQLCLGIDYWLQRLEAMLVGPFGHHGLAIGDVNGDGLDDLYICQPGGLPNLLLVRNEDGTVADRAPMAGMDLLDLSRSALIVDLDNDGDQDLVVATISHLLFFANDGHGIFSPRFKSAEIRDAHSITAADFDGDGDLDIHACVYSGDAEATRESPTPIPIHDARNGGRNVLLRNDVRAAREPWAFTDVTTQTGLDKQNNRWSYAAAWEDFDVDGDVDLLVANDFGRNSLHRNDDSHFVDISSSAGLDQSAFGMSVSWGDYDQDGLMDVYLSNMFSGAGNRVTGQPNFQAEASAEARRALRQTARGNSLFRNLGHGKFQDVSREARVTMGRWAWSSLFCDINNDSRPDLLVGNGFLSREATDDL
jgi:hypothetical protein